jgi:glycosyltransferase involved in cell wall biosynthesis
VSDAFRVSVVVIFRDAAPFIDEAIQSVMAQTYTDWELLLVDDGSADGSTVQALNWANRYPERMRYLEHTGHANRGMSASRNLGVRHAHGELIALLDADDVWFPSALREQVELVEAWPDAAMVYGPIQWWYSWSGRAEDRARDVVERLGVPADALVRPPKLLRRFVRNHAAVPSGALIRRTAVERVGGFEEGFRAEYEDQAFCAKICLEFSVFASGSCWYRYRQHADSCVSVSLKTGRARQTRIAFLEWLAAYLRSQGATSPSVWWAVQYELWRWKHPSQYRLFLAGLRAPVNLVGRLAGQSGRVAEMAR